MTSAVTSSALAAALASTAAAILLPSPASRLRRLGQQQPRHGRWRPGALVWAALALVGWALWRSQGTQVVVLGACAAATTGASQRLTADWRHRQERIWLRAAAVELCDALAAELDAGLPATIAIERACSPWPEFSGVASAARLGDDVAAALRRCANLPGADGLRSVAAAWDVAARSGAALVLVLGRVTDGMRSDEEARAEVTAALGPPRATAKMLAALPLFGIALGVSMGAHPLRFLLQTALGAFCLAVGLGLALTGVWWVEKLAAAAET